MTSSTHAPQFLSGGDAPSPPVELKAKEAHDIDNNEPLEEETVDGFAVDNFCPANIGEVVASKYQIIDKLGFRRSSTVWLARDLQSHRYVTLKIYSRSGSSDIEVNIYRVLAEADPIHPGSRHVRTALDMVDVHREGGNHLCLAQKPVWIGLDDFICRGYPQGLPMQILKSFLLQLFNALDFLHSTCKLIHTDMKGDNIYLDIEDETIFDKYTTAQLENPFPRKHLDNYTVYASRRFANPSNVERIVLGDFGLVANGNRLGTYYDVQPNVYRCPEVMLETEWSHPIDIWNVGVKVWQLFEGKPLFNGQDPNGKGYSTRAHLAEIVGAIGFPPIDVLQKGKRSGEFFSTDREWITEIGIPTLTLEASEQKLEGEEKVKFLGFMRKMLQWRQEDRRTAGQMMHDPWLNGD